MYQYHLFYDDGYPEDGCVGMASYATVWEALNFMRERMADDHARSVDQYVLIKGKILDVKAVEVVTKLIAEE